MENKYYKEYELLSCPKKVRKENITFSGDNITEHPILVTRPLSYESVIEIPKSKYEIVMVEAVILSKDYFFYLKYAKLKYNP